MKNGVKEIHSRLAELLKKYPESADLVADILLFIPPCYHYQKAKSKSTVIGYQIDHTGQLAEERPNRQPFRIDHESYNAVAMAMSQEWQTYPQIKAKINTQLEIHTLSPLPDMLARMTLRFWHKNKLIERGRKRYRILHPNFQEEIQKIWK